MKASEELKQNNNRQFYRSTFRFLFGGALGAITYILIAQAVVDQTDLRCYQTGLIRSIVEASLFSASALVPRTIPPESIYYQPVLYALSSIPYAVLGTLIALKVNKVIILVVGFMIILWLCLWLAFYVFIFMAQLCG